MHVTMLMYNLIEYNDNYSKTYGSLCQYYRDEPITNDVGDITNFTAKVKQVMMAQ